MLQSTTSETTEEYKFKKAILNKRIKSEKRWTKKEMLESLKKCKVVRKYYESQSPFIKNDNDVVGTNKNSRIIPETLRQVKLLNNSSTIGNIIKYERLI